MLDVIDDPHLGFRQGRHGCLGASLARLALRLTFEEALARFARFEITEPVARARENRLLGLAQLPMRRLRR